MSNRARIVAVLLTAPLLSGWVALAEPVPPAPPPALPEPPAARVPVHTDAKDLEQAMLDATLGLVRGDNAAVKGAFDRAEKDSRRMTHAEDKSWKRDMVNNDLAMHMALDHARESAGRGDLETAMESFQWIVRTCRDCHKIAAKP